MADTERGSTTAQLKHDIDSGRTGDKVAVSDVAMSPLGTDDEAGGRPNSPAAVDLARAQESRTGKAGVERTPGAQEGGMVPLIWISLAIAVFALLIIGAFAMV